MCNRSEVTSLCQSFKLFNENTYKKISFCTLCKRYQCYPCMLNCITHCMKINDQLKNDLLKNNFNLTLSIPFDLLSIIPILFTITKGRIYISLSLINGIENSLKELLIKFAYFNQRIYIMQFGSNSIDEMQKVLAIKLKSCLNLEGITFSENFHNRNLAIDISQYHQLKYYEHHYDGSNPNIYYSCILRELFLS